MAAAPPTVDAVERMLQALHKCNKLPKNMKSGVNKVGAATYASRIYKIEYYTTQIQQLYDQLHPGQKMHGLAANGHAPPGAPAPAPGQPAGMGPAAYKLWLAQQALVAAQQNATKQQRAAAAAVAAAAAKELAEDVVISEDDDDAMDHANVYSQYRPAKVTEGKDHPDPIVESQSLASVTAPDISYEHHLQADMAAGRLSNAQLETIIYANMRFREELPGGERAGFFLGDGAGVGKGRQIAALIKEFWLTGGRRILWVSTTRDLAFDARRDLKDMHAEHIEVHPKGKDSPPSKGSLDKHYNQGVLFITYSLLTAKCGGGSIGRVAEVVEIPPVAANRFDDQETLKAKAKETRSDKRKKLRAGKQNNLMAKASRLTQIVEWLRGAEQDGKECLIILDECHKAKNLLDTAGGCTITGLAVEQLQRRLPQARVLYSSATGASEPSNLAYMSRVGCFGFQNMEEMVKALQKSGLGGVEMFAMGLKATGVYLSRTLSYREAEFRLEQVDIDPAFRVMYDRATEVWTLLFRLLNELPKTHTGKRDVRKSVFWGAHQRFFKTMLIAAKVRTCANLAQKALADGMTVVIGLQSTGEANMAAAKEQDGEGARDDLVSAPQMVLNQFVSKHLFNHTGSLPAGDSAKLLAQVYKAVVEWRRLPSCADQAVLDLKNDARRKAKIEKIEAHKARQAEARAGGAAGADAGGPAGAGADAARPAGAGAAAAAGVAAADDDDDDEVLVAVEHNLDDALEERKARAMRAGNYIDLTARDMDEAKVADIIAQIEADETRAALEAEDKHYEKAKRELETQLAEAEVGLKQAQQSAVQAAQRGAEAAAPAKGVRTGRLASNGGAAAAAATVGDDDLLMDAEEPSGPRKGFTAGASRKRAFADDEEDVAEDEIPSKAARSAGGSKQGVKAGAPKPVSARQLQDLMWSDEEEQPPAPPAPDKHADNMASSSDEEMLDVRATRAIKSVAKAPAHRPMTNTLESEDEDAVRSSSVSVETEGGQHEGAGSKAGTGRKLRNGGRSTSNISAYFKPAAGGQQTEFSEVVARRRVAAAEKEVERSKQLLQKHDQQRRQQIAAREDPNQPMPEEDQPAAAGRGVRRGAANGAGGTADASASQYPAYRMAVKSKPLAPDEDEEEGAQSVEENSDEDDAPWGRGRGRGRGGGAARGRGGRGGRGRGGASEESPSGSEASVEEEDLEELFGARPAQGRGRGRGRGRGYQGPGRADDVGARDDDGFDPDEEEDLGLAPQLKLCRTLLLRLIDALELPPNPLDQLTHLLGGESNVAEMTGRKSMMVIEEDGRAQYKVRRPDEARALVNLKEKDDFMNGTKLVAIISEAASTGISLQADLRVKNQRRRFHITLELPWSADRAIQQFGRSHRSGQASAPVYCLLVTKCGGEYRFAGAMAKRLASLGALLQGDQKALGAAGNLKAYDVDTTEAGKGLQRIYEDISELRLPMPGVKLPELGEQYFDSAELQAAGGLVEDMEPATQRAMFYSIVGDAMVNVGLATNREAYLGLVYDNGGPGVAVDPKVTRDVPRFLNRLLGMPLPVQDLLFKFFSDTMQATIRAAKLEGKFSEGMEVLRDCIVTVVKKQEIHKDRLSGASSFYIKLRVDDGTSANDAFEARRLALADLHANGMDPIRMKKSTFYESNNEWKAWKKCHIVLATETAKSDVTSRINRFRIRRPWQKQAAVWPEYDLKEKYKPISDERARVLWDWWHKTLLTGCLHGPNCHVKKNGGECGMCCRVYHKHIVSGALLPVLHTLFETVETSPFGRNSEGRKNMPRALRCSINAAVNVPISAAAAVTSVAPSPVRPSAAGPSSGRGGGSRSRVIAGPRGAPAPAAPPPATVYVDLTLDSDDEGPGTGKPSNGHMGSKVDVILNMKEEDTDGEAKVQLGSGSMAGPSKALVAKAGEGDLSGAGAAPAAAADVQLMVGFCLLAGDVDMFMNALEMG